MELIQIKYGELSKVVLIQIFQIADALKCTPLEAAEMYLVKVANNSVKRKEVA